LFAFYQAETHLTGVTNMSGLQRAKKKGREIARAPKRQDRADLKYYDTACDALERAKSVDEVKEIKNQADAMKHYARQATGSTIPR
jgi:hypothetical protein